MTDNTAAPAPGTAALVARLAEAGEPFALLHRRAPRISPDTVEVLFGEVGSYETLAELPLPQGAPGRPVHDLLALVPYRQLRERGFEVRDDGTPLQALRVRESYLLPLAELRAALPQLPVRLADGGFDVDDERYAEIVRRVVADEIGRGEGANFVIRRDFTGVLDGFRPALALTLFRRLLEQERGAYWTFLVHTGERVLVGASPEVHVRQTGGTVVMNPISGTYRYPAAGPSLDSLLAFLGDRKELEELTMVVDEELKMMCAVGELQREGSEATSDGGGGRATGGQVLGPRLKEMSHLAHTEYELRGRTSLDVREVLRQTMFAATVTGSPLQNATRVISRHEPTGRGYYAGALALIGRTSGGGQTLDSPILIRTADIDPASGRLSVRVGATLVRHSDPDAEVAETHAKAAGVLSAIGAVPARTDRVHGTGHPRFAENHRVQAALDARRTDLSPFWLRMQTPADAAAAPADGQHVLVVDCEDTFTSMLAHLLRSFGHRVTLRRYDLPGLAEAVAGHRGPLVLGPGPGDPADLTDPRMRLLQGVVGELMATGRPGGLLAVCLSHQLLCAALGLPLRRKAVPYQGAQERIDLFGRQQTVGFYNTFTAVCDEADERRLAERGIEVSRDPLTGDVFAVRGPGFAGLQFHPESVLTMDGVGIVGELLRALAPQPA